ncbi:hypothetical protein D7V80_23115 [Corallococcus sp. CA054B]|nr:hypothetical protein D7V80_23115 [Corallococcus sp. CA054B]
MPEVLTYPAYTVKPSLTVSWSGTGGWDDYYELEELQGYGYWHTVYSGASTHYTANVQVPGTYRYRVRACNYYGCSYSREGSATVSNPAPVVDLYGEYPFLYTHDQQNAQYTSQTQGFNTGYATQGSSSPYVFGAQDLVNGQFHLGQGFNLLKDDYARICLDTQNPAFRIVSNPVNSRSMTVTRAVNVSHLGQLLDVNLSAGLSLGLDGFSLNVSGNKRRFTEQLSDGYQEYVVVRWERQFDHWTLETTADPIKPDFVSSMLIPNNTNAKSKFREACGDQFVYAATRGARLYLVFRFDAKRFSQTERVEKSSTLALKLSDILNANGSSGMTQETQQLLSSLNVSVKAYSVGGDPAWEVGLTRDNFGPRFQGFVDSVTTNNSAAVATSMAHYDQPSQYLNYNYFQIFADYREPMEHLRRWNMLDVERLQRCMLSEAYNYAPYLARPACLAGGQELITAKLKCMETGSWSQCVHPLSYYPSAGTVPSSTLLFDWLGQNVTSLEPVSISQYFNHHVKGSFGNKKCQSFDDYTCLPQSTCVRDFTKGSGRGTSQGFDHYLHMWDGPGNGSGWDVTASGHCVRSPSTLCSSQFGDSTADYQFTQTVHGQCPNTRAFTIVN